MKEGSDYRVFVGGLAPNIQENEIMDRFKSFGSASDVYLVHKKDSSGDIVKTFGYLNLKTTEQQLNKCFAIFGGTKWKGHSLKVQLARDDFMKRLRKEWENPETIQVSKSKKRKLIEPIKKYDEFLSKCQNLKKMLPGIPIEGKKNWVIGKYGRPLPIVHIPKIPGRKAVKHDPSKHCHCIKKIPEGDFHDSGGDNLTWEMDEVKHLQDKVKPVKRSKKIPLNVFAEPIKNSIDKKIGDRDTKLKPREKAIEPNLQHEIHDKQDFEVESMKEKDVKESRKEEIDMVDNDSADFEIVPQVEIKRSIVINSRFDSSDSEMSDLDEIRQKIKPSDSISKETLEKKSQVVEIPEDMAAKDETLGQQNKEENGDSCDEKFKDVSEAEEVATPVPSKVFKTPGRSKNLSDSIVKQLQLVKKSVQSTPGKMNNILTYGEDKEDEERSTNMFDFQFETDKTNKESRDDLLQNEAVNILDGEEEDENFNMFDFTFENLKNATGEQFLKAMEFRWQGEQNGSDKSDDSSDKDKASSPKKKKVESIKTDSSSSDESCVEQSMLDFKFENMENRFENKQDGSVSSEEDSDSEMSEEEEKRVIKNEDNSFEVDKTTKKKDNEKDGERLVKEKVCEKSSSKIQEENDGKENKKEAVLKEENKTKKKKRVAENNNHGQKEKEKVQEGIEIISNKKVKKKKEKNRKDINKSKHHTPGMSEEVRQKSLDAFNERTQKNKQLIKNALKGLDTNQPSTNRIVFEDDDDNSEEDRISNEIKDEVESQSSKSSLWDKSEINEEKLKENKSDEVVNFLDGDDDGNDDITDSDRFAVKPQFQGKEGGKLFKMQLHFGGDERFRLDKRFADGDGHENHDDEVLSSDDVDGDRDEECNQLSVNDDGEENLKEEKERNLALLENVLGKVIKSNKKNKKGKLNSATPYDRYDPTKTGHVNLEVHEEKKRKEDDTEKAISKKKVKQLEEENEVINKNEIVPEVSNKRFYEVDTSLKSLFSSNCTNEGKPSSGFTFLSNQNDEVEAKDSEGADHMVEAKPIKELSWKKGLEEDGDDDIEMLEEKEKTKKEEEKTFSGFFILDDEDERLRKGSTFIRTEEFGDIRKQWENIRRSLHDDFKKKHKDAVRRVRKMKERGFKRP